MDSSHHHPSGSALESIGSPTNPFSPSAEARIMERVICDLSETTDDRHHLLMRPFHTLSLDSVPNEARVVVPPSTHITPTNFEDGSNVMHLASKDLVVVQQSWKEAWFTVTCGHHICRFFYDAGSDNLVLVNVGDEAIIVVSVDPERDQHSSEPTKVKPSEMTDITPGPWRIASAEEVPEILFEFLLLRRRYNLTRQLEVSGRAGSKRKDTMANETLSSRGKSAKVADDRRVFLLNQPTQNRLTSDSTMTINAGNPLIELEPGAILSIKSANETKSTIQETTENYSIVSMRNIAKNKGLRSVFRAENSIFGDIVVKVVTERTGPASSIPRMARNWLNEVRSMRDHDHPAIIKFYGSDARLYSIYMEYLPYSDLAACPWTDAASRYYFAGALEDAVSVFSGMASALKYLHDKKIIHNDIKPANVVYDPARGPVLIDFGLVTTFGDPPVKGGTPWYIPRELLYTNSRGPESDVFALGVVMLHVLKKIPLPESTGPQWHIGSIGKDPAPMTRWLDKIVALRRDLGAKGLEGLVKDMLIALPNERISADGIMRRQSRVIKNV